MKKTVWLGFFLMLLSASFFSLSAQSQLADKINLSREGGTTRGVQTTEQTMGVSQDPVVDAVNLQDAVTVSVQNYSGSAWVEIIGSRGSKQTYIEVYDMGFGVVSLSGLRAGEYTIRITLGTIIYQGTFKKALYGR